MAFASVGTIGTGAVNSGVSVQCNLTTSATVEAGNLIILGFAKDNTNTDGGTTSEVDSVSDTNGRTFSSAHRKANTAVANAACYVEGFFLREPQQLDSGQTITVTMDAQKDGASTAWEFTCSNPVGLVGTPQVHEADAVATTAAMTMSDLPNKEYLFVRLTAQEAEDATDWTPTSGWTTFTPKFSSTSGATDANITIHGEWLITTGTGATSDPGNLPVSADQCSVMFALEEITSTPRSRGFVFG